MICIHLAHSPPKRFSQLSNSRLEILGQKCTLIQCATIEPHQPLTQETLPWKKQHSKNIPPNQVPTCEVRVSRNVFASNKFNFQLGGYTPTDSPSSAGILVSFPCLTSQRTFDCGALLPRARNTTIHTAIGCNRTPPGSGHHPGTNAQRWRNDLSSTGLSPRDARVGGQIRRVAHL